MSQKPILFVDFNGILSYLPFWFSLRDESHPLHDIFAPIVECLFDDNRSLMREWMCGQHTSEEIHDVLHERVGGFDRDALFSIFVEDCKNLDVSEKILDSLEELKGIYTLVLITDNADSFERFTLPANPRISEVFDDIGNSYVTGYCKVDHDCRIFSSFIKKYGVNKEECILLDDSLRNCSEFEKHTGGKGIRVDNEEDVLQALVGI